jgi:hypothetical protein
MAEVANVMRVGTPLENWRAAEKSLAAIDQRISKIRERKYLSPAEERALSPLDRARETARRLADKYWALHLEDLDQKTSRGVQA